MTEPYESLSNFDRRTRVSIDPFAVNPLADDVAALSPTAHQAASTESPAPKLFAGGKADVPPFTASGLDPQLLLKLPYGVRHAAASEPDRAVVLQMFEEYGDDPDARIDHPGLSAAVQRVNRWASGMDVKRDHDAELREQFTERAATNLASLDDEHLAAIVDRARSIRTQAQQPEGNAAA